MQVSGRGSCGRGVRLPGRHARGHWLAHWQSTAVHSQKKFWTCEGKETGTLQRGSTERRDGRLVRQAKAQQFLNLQRG